jgi:uncharacterized protein YkuJ
MERRKQENPTVNDQTLIFELNKILTLEHGHLGMYENFLDHEDKEIRRTFRRFYEIEIEHIEKLKSLLRNIGASSSIVIESGDVIGKLFGLSINLTKDKELVKTYSFIEKKDGKDPKKIDYGTCNWVNFSSNEKGSYELEVRVKDKYSKREFDSHSFVHIEVFDYIQAVIDHVLYPAKENYLVGDTLSYSVITQNTKQTLLSYVLNINGQKVEETDFVSDKKYEFTPKCSGSYSLEIYAKNEKSDREFDTKKEIRLKVYDAPPVTNTRIQCDKTKFSVNGQITFTATSSGGNDVLYQFYIMNKGEWTLVQDYSKRTITALFPSPRATTEF